MGRYTLGLAPLLADAAQVEPGMRVVDVGCGPGGLTAELAARVGGERVAAIDPSAPFVAACRERVPGADVREGAGEALPWDDDAFDAALSCLVIGFMRDPARGVAEMRRVTRARGRVAVCFWHVPRHQMLDLAARAITSVRPDADPHPPFVGVEQGEIRDLLEQAGMDVVADSEMTVAAPYDDFGDFWTSVSQGAGPIADAMATMTPEEVARAEAFARAELPAGAFSLTATAWYAVGRA